jgi:hypothetical protein
MPAYSFQERFIPFLLDGSKDHTVRAERTGRSRHARPGDRIYLYYGMRTKWCRKIGEAICSAVRRIRITEDDVIVYDQNIADQPINRTLHQLNVFAWSDGFRPEGSTADHPSGAFTLMLRFWKQTHQLPFTGVVIYWKDFIPAK